MAPGSWGVGRWPQPFLRMVENPGANAGNPSDDESIGDHAFIDLTADDKGNFHAVWLDKRSGKDKGLYSASYDARTHRWEKNRTVDGMVCDCCWSVLKADRTGRLHALYRDKTPRDMGWAFSGDYGKTWELGGPVGNFDWRIEACVHAGGGLAIEEKGEHPAPCRRLDGKPGECRALLSFPEVRRGQLGRTREDWGRGMYLTRYCGFGQRANCHCLDSSNFRRQ